MKKMILKILILVFIIEITTCIIILGVKIDKLNKKIENIKLINGMIYKDFEQLEEYDEENNLDEGLTIY